MRSRRVRLYPIRRRWRICLPESSRSQIRSGRMKSSSNSSPTPIKTISTVLARSRQKLSKNWASGGPIGLNTPWLPTCERYSITKSLVHCKALQASVFRAGLNENEIPVAEMIELPTSVREPILSAGDRRQREHPDLRLARRARTIANLARVMALLHDSTAARVGALFQLLVQDTLWVVASQLRNRNVRLRESCEWPPSRPTREFIAVAAFGRQLRESDALRSPTPRQSSNLGIRFLVDAFARPQHLVAT